ncbi:hypothetical protein C4J81_07990 [Deltaproteobacteria bacterium Smac51]|nr:hypothetical protein C4J81_07990 [Deltaproteobacteria bacterium Smac51]
MNHCDPSSRIEPAHPSGTAVVFSSDGNYVPYLAAALASLIKAASPGNFYDVMILSSGIGDDDQEKIRGLAQGRENIRLRFFDIRERVKSRSGDFFVNAHLSPAAYYRLFAPSIFEAFGKILYLDCDIIVLKDVAELYGQDLRGKAVGAMRDFFAVRDLPRRAAARWAAQLDMKDTDGYFNSGVMLLDLSRLRAENYEDKWFERLKAVKTPRLHDQDILNHTLEGDVELLDAAWNSLAWIESLGEKVHPGELPEAIYQQYLASISAPKILHYSSRNKPWDLPHLELAERFWEFAARTPYYNRLIFNNLQRLNAENDIFKGRLRFPPLSVKYFFYSLMARLSPGESGARYRAKAFRMKKMNARLKTVLRSWH